LLLSEETFSRRLILFLCGSFLGFWRPSAFWCWRWRCDPGNRHCGNRRSGIETLGLGQRFVVLLDHLAQLRRDWQHLGVPAENGLFGHLVPIGDPRSIVGRPGTAADPLDIPK